MVLDIGLPDGDGINVVDWLHASASDLAHLPLVVYSGRDLSSFKRLTADPRADALPGGARLACSRNSLRRL